MSFRHLLALIVLAPLPALACASCRTLVFAAVFNAQFGWRLLLLVCPVLLLVGFALWLHQTPTRRASHDGLP